MIQFTEGRAMRGTTPLLMGISGPSGSGKTFSAMLIAEGLSGESSQPFFVIDTERGRAKHYAERFSFRHGALEPPFRPSSYLNAIEAAVTAGAQCIVVDTWTHAHDGEGGILEWHEEVAQRMSRNDPSRLEQVRFSAWAEPKADLRKFTARMFSFNCHIIFCMRAKEKVKPIRNAKGKTEPTNVGFEPICTDQFEFELSLHLMLHPNSSGTIDYRSTKTKLPGWAEPVMQGHERLTPDVGRALHRWSLGGDAAHEITSLLDRARAESMRGLDALEDFWKGLSRAHRSALQPHLEELKSVAGDGPC